MASILLAERNLLYLHVPKTAGKSISTVLRAQIDAVEYPVQDMAVAEPNVVQLARQLGRPVDEFTTVAVVRNPWDWAVSGYLHVTRNKPAWADPPTFARFLRGEEPPPEVAQYPEKFATPAAYVDYHTRITPWDHLGLDRMAVNHVIRFENLQADFERVFGLSMELPHVNGSVRTHYADYYDAETAAIVARRHAPLIDRFGYRFEAG